MDSWIRDIASAARSILAAKRFSAVVVCTLALGLGANTAVFGVLNAVVLRPLPYDEPDRLVRVYQFYGGEDGFLPGPAAVAFRDQSQTLDVAAVYTYRAEGVDLTDRAQPERVSCLPVSADYFRVLGVKPMLGAVFARGDERASAGVAVVSERIWRDHLGGRLDAAGQLLSLNGVSHRIVAVLPGSFDDPLQPGVDVWTPIDLQSAAANTWDNHYLSAIARLRPGVTLPQAQAELAAIAVRLQANYGQGSVRPSARVAPLQADTVGSTGGMLWLLFGAVGLLLVIACVNVAGLSLARGSAREPELAIRSALGCSRWRLARQLVVESLLLSMAGGCAGLLLAQVIARVLLVAAPESVSRAGSATSGWIVFAFGFGVAMAAGVAFGLVPALKAARPDLEGALRDSSRGASASRRHTRLRSALVVGQTALALVLLIGAGLLLRSVQRLSTVNLGLKPDNVMTFEVHLPAGRYADAGRRAAFHIELERRIASVHGVRSAAAVSRLPATGTYHSWGTRRPDLPRDSRSVQAEQRVVEGPYFQTLNIPLLQGRTFNDRDSAKGPRQVVVSQELARQMFRGEDPLGRHVRTAGENLEVIGVVGDVPVAARGRILPTVYHSHRQFAGDRNWALTQVVSVDPPASGLLTDLRRELASVDPALVLYQPRMLTDVIERGIAQERFAMLVIGTYALVALALAAVGIYGVLSYSVSRRTREMGIRLALGAPTASVRRLVVHEGGRLAAAGIGLGLVVAALVTRALGSLLFGVSAREPAIFSAAAVTLMAVALAASWIPARTATGVDPLRALKSDA